MIKVEQIYTRIAQKIEESKDKIMSYAPYPWQESFHRSKKRHRWVIAANRAGKTTCGAVESIWTACGWHPFREVIVPNSGWVVSVDFPASRDVAQEKIFEYLPPWMIKTWNKADQLLILKNLSRIGFKSCDSGWLKFQGADKDWVWFDEEPEELVFKECVARIVAGRSLMVWGTMTPLKGITWTYSDIYKSDRQDLELFSASIYDNPALPKEEVEAFERSLNEYEKEARLFGKYVILSGSPVFSPSALEAYLVESEPPLAQGFLHQCSSGEIAFEKAGARRRGLVRVWKYPRKDLQYCIGADVSLGKHDYSCAQVLSNEDEVVAEWHGQVDPDLFGEELGKLGLYYNTALVGVEANAQGLTTLAILKRKAYPRVYYQRALGRRDEKELSWLGWKTSSRTKPLMINDLASIIRERKLGLKIKAVVEELASYHTDDSGEMRGLGYDDRVMALAIAWQLRRLIPDRKKIVIPDYVPANPVTGY